MKKSAFIITESILAVVLAACVVSVSFIANDINSPNVVQEASATESSIQQPSAVETSQETSQDSSEPLEESSEISQKIQFTEPESLSSQPDDLTKYIENYNYKYEYMNFDHLIVVDSKDSQATIYCYQKSDSGYWWNIMGDGKAMTDQCFIGENGADFIVTHGSKKTPMGFYQLGEGFYIDDKPDTTYPMFQITDDTYWVDDPDSTFYNQKVEGTNKKDWKSAEHMISATSAYKYGIVIEYNTDSIDTEAGSAIFLDCGTSPTAGCVSLPEDTMKTILEWLDEDSNAFIFII